MPRPLLVLALLCHVVFAGVYAWLTPAFEGPDENSHYEYAWQLGNAKRLPLASALAAARGLPQTDGAVLAHHPPLYYALLGGVLAVTGTDDTVFGPIGNAKFGVPGEAGRALKFRHGSGQGEGVLRLLRLVSVLLGAVSVWLVHRLGRACCPASPRVADLAALLAACLPMYSFLHGVLNSDVLVVTLASATVLALVRTLQAERLGAARACGVGALLGLALLAKLTALFLFPLAAACGVVLLVRARANGTVRAVALRLAAALGVAALVCGWWLVRNVALYGDPLALAAHDASFPTLLPEHRWGYFVDGFLPNVLESLLGTLGWFSLPPPRWLVWCALATTGLALAGLARAALDRNRAGDARALPRPCWLLLAAGTLLFASVAWFNLRAAQPQGRLLLPAIAPAAVLLAAGLVRLSARLPHRRWLCVLPPLAAAAVLLLRSWPAFARELAPAPASHRALVGAIVREPRAPAIEWLPATGTTLRWRDPGAPPDVRYTLYAFDANGRVLLATHEWTHGSLAITGGELELPAIALAMLPADRDVLLRLRRVPAAAGDDPALLPASTALPFRRP
jgi:hypothetical protein